MKKIYLYKRRSSWLGIDTQFTHFWSNDGENAYDFKTQYTNEDDTQLITVYENFDSLLNYYHPDYIWEDVSDVLSIENPRLDSIILVGNTIPLDVNGDIFVKVVDDNDNVLYYYNSGITETTSQNNKFTNYRILLSLDKWASYRYRFHQYLTELKDVDLLFNQKHCDRFIWNLNAVRGYYLDYNIQTYLNVNLVNLQRPLIKSRDDWFLSLEELLYINSYSDLQYNDWYNNVYSPWTREPFATWFDPNDIKGEANTYSGESVLDEDCFKGKYYVDLEPFQDINYNSNGLYKWLVLKTGDNVHSTTSGEIRGSVFENKTIQLSRKLPNTEAEDLTTVVKINSGTSFINSGQEIAGDKNGESWSFEITQSFNMINNWTAENLEGKEITLSLDGNTLINENEGHFQVWAERNIDNKRTDLYVADTNLYQGMKITIAFPILGFTIWMYLTAIKEYKLNPYFYPTKQDGEYSNRDALLKSQNIKISEIELNKWYTLIDRAFWFQWTENGTPHWEMHEKIEMKIDSSSGLNRIIFRFFMNGTDLPFPNDSDTLKLKTLTNWTFSGLTISCDADREAVDTSLEFTGEEMCLIPVLKSDINLPKKVDESSFSKTIFYLNNSKGVTPGSSGIIGSLINSIPPLVWSIASRKNKIDNKFTLSFTNLISTDRIQKEGEPERFSPFDIHSMTLTKKDATSNQEEENESEDNDDTTYYHMPVMFTDFSYVPITIARSPIKHDNMFDRNECLGGNYFLNHYYQLLTDYELTHQNTMDAEPAMFNPLIYRWVFNIDGFHNITVTSDMLNLNALLEDWEVNLNTVMSSATYYKLDLGNLKSRLYKFTEQFSELSSFDGRNYPYSTSQYYNWLETNQATYQTSKALLDRNLDYNMISGAMGMAIDPIQGALEGGAKFEATGAVAGGIAGSIKGAGNLIQAILLNEKAQKDFATEWDGRLTNKYRSPVSLNVSGFGDGSLNFSSWSESGNYSCNFFRTYVLPEYISAKIWYLIAFKGTPTYGIPYKYEDYDNRRVFNYFELDTHTRHADLVSWIRYRAKYELPLFNSPQFIEDFLSYISGGVRLWKRQYDRDKIEQYILDNIENKYQPPFDLERPDKTFNVNIKNILESQYSSTPKEKDNLIPSDVRGNVKTEFLHTDNDYTLGGSIVSIKTTSEVYNSKNIEDFEDGIPYTAIFPEAHTKEEFKEICKKINFDFKGTDFFLKGNDAQGGQSFNYNFKNDTSINEIEITRDDEYDYSNDLIVYDSNANDNPELDIAANKYLGSYLYYNPDQSGEDTEILNYTTDYKIENMQSSNLQQGCLIWNVDGDRWQITNDTSNPYKVEYTALTVHPDYFICQPLDNMARKFSSGELQTAGYCTVPYHDYPNGYLVDQQPYHGVQTIPLPFSQFGCNTFEEFKEKVKSIHLPTRDKAYINQHNSAYWSWAGLGNERYYDREHNGDLEAIFSMGSKKWEWDKTANGHVTAVANVCFWKPFDRDSDSIKEDFYQYIEKEQYYYCPPEVNNPILLPGDDDYDYGGQVDPFTCRVVYDNRTVRLGKLNTVLFNKVTISWRLNDDRSGIIFTLDSKPYVGGWINQVDDPKNIKYLAFGDIHGARWLETFKFGYNRRVIKSATDPDIELNEGDAKNMLFNLSVDYIPTVLPASHTNIKVAYKTKITLNSDGLDVKIDQENSVNLTVPAIIELRNAGMFHLEDWVAYLASKNKVENDDLLDDNYQNNLKIEAKFNALNFFKK